MASVAAAPPASTTACSSASAVARSTSPVTGRPSSSCSRFDGVDGLGPVDPVDGALVVAGGGERGLQRRGVVGHRGDRLGLLLVVEAAGVGEEPQPGDLTAKAAAFTCSVASASGVSSSIPSKAAARSDSACSTRVDRRRRAPAARSWWSRRVGRVRRHRARRASACGVGELLLGRREIVAGGRRRSSALDSTASRGRSRSAPAVVMSPTVASASLNGAAVAVDGLDVVLAVVAERGGGVVEICLCLCDGALSVLDVCLRRLGVGRFAVVAARHQRHDAADDRDGKAAANQQAPLERHIPTSLDLATQR